MSSRGWTAAVQARRGIVGWLMRMGFAADVAEEAYATALAELCESTPTGAAPPELRWLCRRALWRAEDERRRARRARRAMREMAVLSAARDPEDMAVDRVHAGQIDAELRRRSPLERAVLYLRAVAGYTERETAEVYQIDTGRSFTGDVLYCLNEGVARAVPPGLPAVSRRGDSECAHPDRTSLHCAISELFVVSRGLHGPRSPHPARKGCATPSDGEQARCRSRQKPLLHQGFRLPRCERLCVTSCSSGGGRSASLHEP